MTFLSRRIVPAAGILAALLLLLLLTTGVRAQTSAGDLFKPWAPQAFVEARGDAALFDSGHTKRSNDDFQLSMYSTQGRWRLDDSRRINPTAGYDLLYLNLDTKNPRLPGQLLDTSVGVGSPIAMIGQNWFLAASAAVGYAGANPFGDGSAYYGKATILLGRELGPDSNIIVGLDYDGHRTFFPDVPLPGFAYTFVLNPTIRLAVGFPYNTIYWKPADKVQIDATWTVPTLFDVKASYALSEHWKVFLNYRDTINAFDEQDLPNDRSLFFEQSRVEAGVRWDINEGTGFFVAGGYAFRQRFTTGFDSRNLTTVEKISDEPYVRLGFEARF